MIEKERSIWMINSIQSILEVLTAAKLKEKLRFIGTRFSQLYILAALAGMFAIFSVTSPYFLTPINLENLVIRASLLLVLSIGMTFVLVGGEIDLSVGSVTVLSQIVVATILRDYGISGVFMAVAGGALAGLGIGLINGIVVSRFHVNSFIVTMGTMAIARSIAEIMSPGIITGVPPKFSEAIGGGYIGFIPVLAVMAGITALIGHLVLSRTVFGNRIQGIGANEKAALYCGIQVKRYKLVLFIISGLLASLGGVMLVGRTGSGQPGLLLGFELDAIAATVIGGATFRGGEGSIIGTVIGTLIITSIANQLNLLGVDQYYGQVVSGIIILCAVFIAYSKR